MRLSFRIRLACLAAAGIAAGALAGCEDQGFVARATQSLPDETLKLMAQKGVTKEAPVLIRAYKKEAEFEVWKMRPDGSYVYLKTFPMCRWSGQLGPKKREGDRQVPEGFYTITPGQINPRSAYYLSFNVGYPNAYDRALGHEGGSIMVHGACSSSGCFSMTDQQIAEIYAIAREAFAGGQRAIQMQSFPFKMTPQNLAKHRLDPNMPFWKEIKRGADNFEVTKREVAVNVCNRHYVFNAAAADGSPLDPEGACPALKQDVDVAARVAERERADDAEVAQLTVQGVQPVRLVYQDGGQNPVFANRIADVSRPEALAAGPVEIALNERGRKLPPGAQSSSPKIAAAPPVAAPTQIAQGAAAPAPAESGFSSVSSLIGMLRGGDQPAAAPPAPAPVAAPAPAAQASGGKSQATLANAVARSKPIAVAKAAAPSTLNKTAASKPAQTVAAKSKAIAKKANEPARSVAASSPPTIDGSYVALAPTLR